MAIRESETGKYIKIDKTRLFECHGFVPVLIYKNQQERQEHPERGVPSIINLKIVPSQVDAQKDTIDNLITSLYQLIKTSIIKKSQITYIDTEPYKNYIDC